MKYTEEELAEAHKSTYENRHVITPGSKCGCMYCIKIFKAEEIIEWCPDANDDTAICPYCGIDAVLSENSGFPLNEEFLKAAQEMWF